MAKKTMLCSPVDNGGGPCQGKQNADKQCPPHQKFECSVGEVRGPIQANMGSFDEKPEEDSFKNDTFTDSKACGREDTGCSSRISRNGSCGARMSEESRPAKETTIADDLKNSRGRRPGFDDEQQIGAGSSRRNSKQWSGLESLQVSTSTFRPAKSPTTDRKSVPLPNNLTLTNQTMTNRTATNRSDGTLQFEKELYKVEQRRAHLMRCIERKQKELMMENRKVRTSLQDHCEQQSSGGEKQSLHDTKERRPSHQDTRERLQSRYDTSERQQSRHDASRRRQSQYDTSKLRPSQHDIRVHRPSQYDNSQRRSSQHDTRERRESQYDNSQRRSSHFDNSQSRSSQHDTRERRKSQAQHDTRERQSSNSEIQNRKPPQGSFVFECFCNFRAADNRCNNEPTTKPVQHDESYQPLSRGVSNVNSGCPVQMSPHRNNTNADDTTEVRQGAASTGRHSSSGRCSRPRNNASVTSPDSAEQKRSHQDTPRPRGGCPCPRVVDLIPSTINSSATSAAGGTREHNNRGWNETQ